MAELTTEYMGIKLSSPLVIASSSMTQNLENIKKFEELGSGAVVIKSLFEEQVQKEMIDDIGKHMGPSWHTEAYEYVQKMGIELGPKDHLKLIEDAKKSVKIPVIASLNAINLEIWKKYAKQLENSGADAIEANISFISRDLYEDTATIEDRYFKIIKAIKDTVSIPVAVKIGPFFTSLGSFAREICRVGADGLVLFNRFYRFDIDIEKLKIVGGNPLSSSDETNLPLRWVALLSGRIECDIASTTGIHEVSDVIKHLLAGAKVVQICSALYKKGKDYLRDLNDGLNKWLNSHGYSKVNEIIGKLSFEKSETPEIYERLQYVKSIGSGSKY